MRNAVGPVPSLSSGGVAEQTSAYATSDNMSLVAAQSSVGWSERGVVTGANLFARSLGSAVGVAVFGAVANAAIGAGHHTDPARLTSGVQHVFLGVAILAVLLAVVIVLMPRNSGPNPPQPEFEQADEPAMLER